MFARKSPSDGMTTRKGGWDGGEDEDVVDDDEGGRLWSKMGGKNVRRVVGQIAGRTSDDSPEGRREGGDPAPRGVPDGRTGAV